MFVMLIIFYQILLLFNIFKLLGVKKSPMHPLNNSTMIMSHASYFLLDLSLFHDLIYNFRVSKVNYLVHDIFFLFENIRLVLGTFCYKGQKCKNGSNLPLGSLDSFVSGDSNPKFTMYSKQRLIVLCGKRNQNKLKYKKMQKKKKKKEHTHTHTTLKL